MQWTALTGVTPYTRGSSVNRARIATVTANDCVAVRPPGSVAVTRTVAAPSPTAVTVTNAPVTVAVTTWRADEDTVYVKASPSGSPNALDTSTLAVSSGASR